MKHRICLPPLRSPGRCSRRRRWRRPMPPAMISVTGEATISVPPIWRRSTPASLGSQDRARGLRGQQRGDGQGAAGAQGRRHRGEGHPDLAAVAAAANTSPTAPGRPPSSAIAPATGSPIRLRDVTKVASVIDMLVGAGANDIGGINFIGVASVETARRRPRTGRRRCPPQGRNLRQGRRRHAGRAAQHLRGRRARPDAFSQVARRMAASPTPMAQGEETLQVTVSVSWAIKPAP